jgi:hypothetical protein
LQYVKTGVNAVQGNCTEDNWSRAGNTQGLVCTAKEVYLENIAVDFNSTCSAGDFVDVNINATVVFTTGRYDAGWYIATDGGNALRGSCAIKVLREEDGPLNLTASRNNSTTVVGNVSWDKDAKGTNDACGDIFMTTGGGGVLDYTNIAEGLKLPCIDSDGDGVMDFGICFSWRQPGADDTCDPNALYPGSPSKCFCTNYDIPQIKMRKAEKPKKTEWWRPANLWKRFTGLFS